MNDEMISQITNYSLIGLFVLICLGLVIAFIRGWKKGIWRTCFRMFFMITLFVLAFCLLQTLTDALAVAPVNFTQYKSIILSNDAGETYYVAITTFQETVTELAKGYYYINHIPYSYERIVALATSFATTTVKMTAVLLQFLMILIFGNLLCLILWHLVFKKIVPLIAQKLMKVKWLAMLQNGVTYLLVLTLFISPLTTMVNLLNQSYQQNKDIINKNNQIVQTATSFLDTYNESIFNNLFSWSADEDGITFDAKLMGWLTESSSEYGTLNLVNEFDNLLDLSMYLTNALGEGLAVSFDYASLISEATVDAIFDAIEGSEILTIALPVALTIATNMDVVEDTIDLSDIDFEKYTYTGDGSMNGVLRDVLKKFIASGIFDEFIDDEGSFSTDINVKELIKGLVTDRESFDIILDALDDIDDSELLSDIMPSVMLMLNDTVEEADKYLPDTWNEMASIKWGKELTIVLDTLQRIATVGEDNEVLDVILDLLPGDSPKAEAKRYASGEGSDDFMNKLLNVIFKNIEEIEAILVGDVNDEYDENGKTKLINDEDRLNIFDCELMKWIFNPLIELIGDSLGSAVPDKDKLDRDIIRSKLKLSQPDRWRNNYRKEFAAILKVIEKLSKSDDTINLLNNPGDFFSDLMSIDEKYPSLTKALTEGFIKLDDSIILSDIFGQIFEDALVNNTALVDVGLDPEVMKEGFKYCNGENPLYPEVKCVGKELALIMSNISSISKLKKIGDSSDPVKEISEDKKNKENIANLLDVLYMSKLLNGGLDEKGVEQKENYFNSLDFLFGRVHNAETSLVFNIDSFKDQDIKWMNARKDDGENKKGFLLADDVFTNAANRGENGNIAQALFTLSEQNLTDKFKSISSIKDSISAPEVRGAIKTTLTEAGKSVILSSALGGFLDNKLAGKGLTDNEANFSNVKDWELEANNLDKLLESVASFEGNLESLDLQSCTDIVGLNNLLHSLAGSTIFYDKDNNYIFSHWMYNKVTSTLKGEMDLFKDPEEWINSLWGEKQTIDTHSIARNDFYSLTEKNMWSSNEYESNEFNQDKLDQYITDTYLNYYENPNFYKDYFYNGTVDGLGRIDELGKICELVYFISCRDLDISNIGKETDVVAFKGALDAINNTDTLRIAIYNAYTKVASTVGGTGSTLVNLDQARNEYLVNCNVTSGNIVKPSESRAFRANEIEIVCNLFNLFKKVGNGAGQGIADIFGFTDDELDDIANSVSSMGYSNVYHLLGPIDTSKLTAFQSLVSHIYDSDPMKDDLFYRADGLKDSSASYTTYGGKVESVVKGFYKFGNDVDSNIMKTEINAIFESIKYLKQLPTSGGVIDMDTLDFSDTTISNIENSLKGFDKTETLFDVVPNIFFRLFNEKGFSTLGEGIMSNANTDFMYVNTYEGQTGSISEPNFNNRVKDTEIERMMNILRKYNELGDDCDFSNVVELDSKSNKSNIVRDMLEICYDSYMFHQFNNYKDVSSPNLTVFEGIINKIITETQLAQFSYDYNSRGFDREDLKTLNRIKIVSNYDGETLTLSDPSLDSVLVDYLTHIVNKDSIRWFEKDGTKGQVDYIFDFISFCQDNNFENIGDVVSHITTIEFSLVDNFRKALDNIYLCKDASNALILV